jgi:hypothetical protein
MSEHAAMPLALKLFLMLYQFLIHLNFSETTFTYWIYRPHRYFLSVPMTPALGVNSQVNETLETNAPLNITPEAINFITQILFTK